MSNKVSPNNSIKSILESSDLSAKKNLGQNFLHDSNIINKMIEGEDINNDDTILEIGPGLGTLTKPLSSKAKHIIAVEKDRDLADWLENNVKEEGISNISIIRGDALKEIEDPDSTLNSILPKDYKVIANIPYYLTSHLIRILLEKEDRPQRITLMIQKEVAERICNRNGNSILSISVNYYADPKIIHIVSKNCFHPKPKIDSAIISLTPKEDIGNNIFTEYFFRLLKTGFSSPRKQLLKNLSQLGEREVISSILKSSGIDPEQRAETLSLSDWKNLTNAYLAALKIS
ncbi:MAG: 16S rRNA (adenine(1518)-N(6)/adenine(1519)-N(6))-dimethyltransferase RsmA [Candidatus Pacebacteria bacterium]|nr:16S rRNA (adenine(1518)-N(6)/adenine(1519)-N(6))-dimethyltransferase RsmA [Candidatus Paceibacterota bacterium]